MKPIQSHAKIKIPSHEEAQIITSNQHRQLPVFAGWLWFSGLLNQKS
jgi:hypothetical protein